MIRLIKDSHWQLLLVVTADVFKNTYLVKMDVVRRLFVQLILPAMVSIPLYIVLIFCP